MSEKSVILVVDDDKVVTQMLKKWITDAGYECLVATTASEGWKLLQEKNVTLVITDVNMPGEYDGFGLLDRIMKLKEQDAISVIMISGESKDVAVKGVTLGSNDFMVKPLIKALILKKIEILLEHRQSKLELQKERQEKEELRKEIASLNNIMQANANVVETPIQTITATIASLLNEPDLSDNIRRELQRLRSLAVSSSNLYQPTTGNPSNLDAVTKSFLANEFGISSNFPGLPNLQSFASIKAPVAEDITLWSFNVFERTEDELLVLAKQMFLHLGLLKEFDIEEECLEKFLVAVRQNYKNNPYHNWIHAFDVTQATFCYLTQFQGLNFLTNLDVLALLVASLCHDLGHPGVNNAFMVSTNSELALLYNDQSVLENFHTATLFQLLKAHPELNIFRNLPVPKYREIRKLIIECIISTDPAVHYEYVTKLSSKAGSDNISWNREDAGQRLLLMKSIIKMADISNVARAWDRAGFEWSKRVTQEFFNQGDREKQLGHEVAAFLDREATTVYKNSMNFIDFFAAPLFNNLGKLDKAFGEKVVTTLILNRGRWETELEKHNEAEKQKAAN